MNEQVAKWLSRLIAVLILCMTVNQSLSAQYTCPTSKMMTMSYGGQTYYHYLATRYENSCTPTTTTSMYSATNYSPLPGDCNLPSPCCQANPPKRKTNKEKDGAKALDDGAVLDGISPPREKLPRNIGVTRVPDNCRPVTDFYFKCDLGNGETWAHAFIMKGRVVENTLSKWVYFGVAFESVLPDVVEDEILHRDHDEAVPAGRAIFNDENNVPFVYKIELPDMPDLIVIKPVR
jgi:hypothetical protein